MAQFEARRALLADCEMVTSITTLAFANDPLWSRAMAPGGCEYRTPPPVLEVVHRRCAPLPLGLVDGWRRGNLNLDSPRRHGDERRTGGAAHRACQRVSGVGSTRLSRTTYALRCRAPA